MSKIDETQKIESIKELQKLLKPGDTVYTVLRHVSTSGMSRAISVHIIRNNEPLNISWSVANVIGEKLHTKHEGIKIDGCGMDMGFSVVYDLSRELFPNGFDVQGIGRNGDTSGHDNDGGYALKQRWL
jgi:hypothetical protein